MAKKKKGVFDVFREKAEEMINSTNEDTPETKPEKKKGVFDVFREKAEEAIEEVSKSIEGQDESANSDKETPQEQYGPHEEKHYDQPANSKNIGESYGNAKDDDRKEVDSRRRDSGSDSGSSSNYAQEKRREIDRRFEERMREIERKKNEKLREIEQKYREKKREIEQKHNEKRREAEEKRREAKHKYREKMREREEKRREKDRERWDD